MKRLQFYVLVGVLVGLVLGGGFLIWLFPPSGEVREVGKKRQKSEFGLEVEMLSLNKVGVSEILRHDYSNFGEGYSIDFKQKVEDVEGHFVKLAMKSKMLMRHDSLQVDTLAFNFKDFEIKFEDSEGKLEDEELLSIDSMLSGVELQAGFDIRKGIGVARSQVSINPQVARVLYLLCELYRMGVIFFPEEGVGVGSYWEYKVSLSRSMLSSKVKRGAESIVGVRYERSEAGRRYFQVDYRLKGEEGLEGQLDVVMGAGRVLEIKGEGKYHFEVGGGRRHSEISYEIKG